MSPGTRIRDLAQEVASGGRVFPRVWGRRTFWQVRLRWWVPPSILVGTVCGRLIGFEYPYLPFILIALGIFAYNAPLAIMVQRSGADLDRGFPRKRAFTIMEVALDYAAMFLLVYWTGGPSSPLIFLFIFHVIFAAIQFKPGTAYLFAAIATLGVWLMVLLQGTGVLPPRPLTFRGVSFNCWEMPAHMAALLFFFTATVITTAITTTRIMRRLRDRVSRLTKVSQELGVASDRLRSLYSMLRTVGSETRLDPILAIVTQELRETLEVAAVAVKLLSDDRETLRYVAHDGLPDKFFEKNVAQLARSPLNRTVMEGEPVVIGDVTLKQELQFPEELVEMGVRSAVYAPLRIQDRVIGILGAYCYDPDRFDRQHTEFLRLAAELVAIAVENARGYTAIRELIDERSNFMLRVAHNMRAPLAGSLSQLDLVRGGYMGEVDERQGEILERVDRRLRVLNQTIGELLTLARSREASVEFPPVAYAPEELAERMDQIFRAKAAAKGLELVISLEKDLPALASYGDLLPQLVENLVSNAVKYTPEGGRVSLTFLRSPDGEGVQMLVQDTGIGIPAAEQSHLFSEFFRASNARDLEEEGTGLGLVLVKRTVDRLGGDLKLASEEGRGTTVRVTLPPAARQTG